MRCEKKERRPDAFSYNVFICRLMTEKIAIRAGIEISAVTFMLLLADGKRHGRIRVALLDSATRRQMSSSENEKILTAPKDKGAEVQVVAFVARGENFIFRKTVAGAPPGCPRADRSNSSCCGNSS